MKMISSSVASFRSSRNERRTWTVIAFVLPTKEFHLCKQIRKTVYFLTYLLCFSSKIEFVISRKKKKKDKKKKKGKTKTKQKLGECLPNEFSSLTNIRVEGYDVIKTKLRRFALKTRGLVSLRDIFPYFEFSRAKKASLPSVVEILSFHPE